MKNSFFKNFILIFKNILKNEYTHFKILEKHFDWKINFKVNNVKHKKVNSEISFFKEVYVLVKKFPKEK